MPTLSLYQRALGGPAYQRLAPALSAFARQTGLQLAFPPELVQGKQGRAVAGARPRVA